jgi:hypothetical protein
LEFRFQELQTEFPRPIGTNGAGYPQAPDQIFVLRPPTHENRRLVEIERRPLVADAELPQQQEIDSSERE